MDSAPGPKKVEKKLLRDEKFLKNLIFGPKNSKKLEKKLNGTCKARQKEIAILYGSGSRP